MLYNNIQCRPTRTITTVLLQLHPLHSCVRYSTRRRYDVKRTPTGQTDSDQTSGDWRIQHAAAVWSAILGARLWPRLTTQRGFPPRGEASCRHEGRCDGRSGQRKPGQRTCDSNSPQVRSTGFYDQPYNTCTAVCFFVNRCGGICNTTWNYNTMKNLRIEHTLMNVLIVCNSDYKL